VQEKDMEVGEELAQNLKSPYRVEISFSLPFY